MNVKKIIGLLLIAFVVFYLVTNPDNAANIVSSIGRGLRSAAESLSKFVQSIGS
jgi:hypothetical protein